MFVQVEDLASRLILVYAKMVTLVLTAILPLAMIHLVMTHRLFAIAMEIVFLSMNVLVGMGILVSGVNFQNVTFLLVSMVLVVDLQHVLVTHIGQVKCATFQHAMERVIRISLYVPLMEIV